MPTANLQTLLDSFSADVRAYIDQEVQQRVAAGSGQVSQSAGSAQTELQQLESILDEFKQSSTHEDLEQQVDELITSLEAFGAKETDVQGSDEDAMELLRSMKTPQEENFSKAEAVDFYIEKLNELNGTTQSATIKPDNNKPSGIAFVLKLLQRYKKATLNDT